MPALLGAGYRVITYDRRGFGDSSRPVSGYDSDTLAGDLNALMSALDLRDAALIGFSMGGGEVARYLGVHGTGRVGRVVFIAATPPFLLRTPENQSGMEEEVFTGIRAAIMQDRPSFLTRFLSDFYNTADPWRGRVSEEALRMNWLIAVSASPGATLDCVSAWLTDVRGDLPRIDVPVLIIHGDTDRILPAAATAMPLHAAIKGSQLVIVPGGPHGLLWTHAEEVNLSLVEFLAQTG